MTTPKKALLFETRVDNMGISFMKYENVKEQQ